MSKSLPDVQVTVVGDGGSGKTALLTAYFSKEFQADYTPTVMDDHYHTVTAISGKQVEMRICDTSGQENYEEIRKLTYKGANLFLLCYDVVAEASFNNIETYWLREIRRQAGADCPIILCGNKLDLKDKNPRYYISDDDVAEKAKKWAVYDAIQCSAKDFVNDATSSSSKVEEVFSMMVECGIKSMHGKDGGFKKCVIY